MLYYLFFICSSRSTQRVRRAPFEFPSFTAVRVGANQQFICVMPKKTLHAHIDIIRSPTDGAHISTVFFLAKCFLFLSGILIKTANDTKGDSICICHKHTRLIRISIFIFRLFVGIRIEMANDCVRMKAKYCHDKYFCFLGHFLDQLVLVCRCE